MTSPCAATSQSTLRIRGPMGRSWKSASGFDARMMRSAAPNLRQNRNTETQMATNSTTCPCQFIRGCLQMTQQSNVAAVAMHYATGAWGRVRWNPAATMRIELTTGGTGGDGRGAFQG